MERGVDGLRARFWIVPLVAAALSVWLATGASAAVPSTFSVQGVALTSSGVPASGQYDIELRLFAQPSGGVSKWSKSYVDVPVQGGVFDVVLGPIGSSVFDGDPALWLEAVVEGEVMPRQPLDAVPYALVAQRANVAVLAGDLECPSCVGEADVGFPYALSDSMGGDAKDVDCDECITAPKIDAGAVSTGHLQSGAVTKPKVGFTYASSASIDGPASDVACGNCVSGGDIAIDVALSGDVSATGTIQACTSALGTGCAVKVGTAGLYDHKDGWVTIHSTNGLRIRTAAPTSASPAPLEFGGGTSFGSLAVQGNVTATGNATVGGTVQASSVVATTVVATGVTTQQVAVAQGASLATQSGSVGIGTDAPVAKLHVVGGVRTDVGSPVRIGNTIYNAFATSLPIGSGYSTLPIHLKTNWVCGEPSVNIMYNVEFKGMHFIAKSEINAVAVGYLYSTNGLKYDNTRTISGEVTVSAYCSPVDSHLVFKLVSAIDWHASDLLVNFISGNSYYTRTAADTFEIIHAMHSGSDI